MKDPMDSAAVGRAPEPETFTNRKLIRPTLNRDARGERTAERMNDRQPDRERAPEVQGMGRASTLSKKTPPPDQTYAENFYYQKQMQARTPMVVVLHDGEQLHGIIEWYDRTCIKLNRSGGHANLLIYKTCIKYIFKESEANGRK